MTPQQVNKEITPIAQSQQIANEEIQSQQIVNEEVSVTQKNLKKKSQPEERAGWRGKQN